MLENDRGPGEAPLSAHLVEAPEEGELELGEDGSFTYTPSEDFTGTVTFTYQTEQERVRSEEATVTITVEAGDEPGDNNGEPGDNNGEPGDNNGEPGDNNGEPGDNKRRTR